ncbi:hypothetical protein [Nocardioides euryhalodurans]|uniref:Uncharacterized protein n=1 Tax=Nocardioides euryhalodurans TaxID=2518370 RepID=A0A4P7GNC7_9ACTN|nr:hypothetical protein [Nocardioides euryhalodurans]QBR93570.1 hypothetical protein EXE57_15795 [Nocardioides euryhalodurans]
MTDTTQGDTMLDFDRAVHGTDTTTDETGLALVDEPATDQDSPFSAAARMLELASETAERLVSDAEAEAASLLAAARAGADDLAEASRAESEGVAAELARAREEQTADLDRERRTALAGLADEKAALEAQIDALREAEADQRHRMRQHLTQHLAMLDTSDSVPPAVIAS